MSHLKISKSWDEVNFLCDINDNSGFDQSFSVLNNPRGVSLHPAHTEE